MSLNNLTRLYYRQGRHSNAELLVLRALEISERAPGSDHPDVVMNLNNFAMLYKSEGWYAKAEPLYKLAIQIQTRKLGDDRPALSRA